MCWRSVGDERRYLKAVRRYPDAAVFVLNLYERFGFVREGFRKGHYSRAGEDVDAILMALAVS